MKALLVGAGACLAVLQACAAPECSAPPLQGRDLYLRGNFNSWNAVQAHKFTWACNRWELVTRLQGEHRFKIADEGWSADADFGAAADAAAGLALRGSELTRRFSGTHRFRLTMTHPRTLPELSIEHCAAPGAALDGGPPLGQTVLYLRGTLNNWAALDDYAFQFSCDAYYLNLKASGRHEFKVADARWSDAATVTQDGANFVLDFSGEHTLRLAWAGGRPQLTLGARSFADPRAAAVTDPLALSLRFDSRSAAHKQPFGAVAAPQRIDFALGAAPGVSSITLVVETRRLEGNQEVLEYTELARVPMRKEPAGNTERWSASYAFADAAVYGYWFEAEIADKRYAYQNNTDAVHWTREKGSGGVGAVADLPLALGTLRRFRQTVYAPDFKVPEWAADAVYYYIFPDRFRNGDPANDPQPGVARYQNHGVELHKRWLDKPYRPGSGDGSDAIYNNDFFGGDLAGIIDKLDYIQALGANAIYMTPIFRAASNHKYDTADYHQVDPAFGSNADFERLTREAAKRGIRVIPDASLNHTGSDSIYFDRFANFKRGGAFEGGKVRPDSPYASWYTFDGTKRDPDKQYKGWVGVSDLPELDKASPAWRRFAYDAPDSVMKRWLDLGAAGWRMDVAPWVSDDFWRQWRRAIKAHRPDAITIAETWFDASKYFLGDMFDSTMNYVLRNALLEYAAGGPAGDLVRHVELLREAYPPQAQHALMNVLSSHDQARSLHVLGWHDGETDAARIALAKQRLLLAVFWQMVLPGSPAIYYGDEVGVTGGDDPYNRAPYPWADAGGAPDTALLAAFKRLTHLRQQHPVLRRGGTQAPLYSDANVVVLARRLGDTWAITAGNNAAQGRALNVPLTEAMRGLKWREVFATGREAGAAQMAADHISLDVPKLGGTVWVASPAGSFPDSAASAPR